jgi:hypothetical protein
MSATYLSKFIKVSFCQRPRNSSPLPYDRPDILTIKDILQPELGMEKLVALSVPFSQSRSKTTRVEPSNGMF